MNMLTALSKQRKENLEFFGPRARGVLVEADNGLFVVDPEDMYVSLSLLQHGIYAEDELKMFKTLVNKDSNVLAIGAHIGAHVIPLSKIVNTVTAIEANPDTFKLLKMNVLLNKCNNVILHNVAVNDEDGEIEFLLNRTNSGGSKRMPYRLIHDYIYDNPKSVKVTSLCFDAGFGAPFDLIVMDIEGSEYFALKGMQKTLAMSKVLAVEFIPDHIRYVANVGIEEFVDLILPHFNTMYIQKDRYTSTQGAIALAGMFIRNESHNLIFFSK